MSPYGILTQPVEPEENFGGRPTKKVSNLSKNPSKQQIFKKTIINNYFRQLVLWKK